jgi:hypothetical protein
MAEYGFVYTLVYILRIEVGQNKCVQPKTTYSCIMPDVLMYGWPQFFRTIPTHEPLT